MSEQPPDGPHAPSGTGGFPTSRGQFPGAGGPPSWPPAPRRDKSRALTFAALATALIATALAIVGWFRPVSVAPAVAPSQSPTYSEQQVADSKSHACAAFETVQRGVKLQTNEAASTDPAMRKAQATSGQLSVVAGGWYLREQLEPATPASIRSAVEHLAGLLLDLGAHYIAGVQDSDPTQGALRSNTVSAFGVVQDLCK
jgi:hypothetical protein